MLGMTSDTMSVPQLYDVADSIVSQKIAQIPGVGLVNVAGSAKPAVRIEANPTLMAGYGLGLEALRTGISQVNVNQSPGYLNGTDWRGRSAVPAAVQGGVERDRDDRDHSTDRDMVDFALVAERQHGKHRQRRSSRVACCTSGRS
jgi:multidrug efflux pump subunit AcrB